MTSALERLAVVLPSSRKEIIIGTLTFVAYLTSAVLFLQLYRVFETSPAIVWPPVGIALVAFLFGGYRMWLPVMCAQYIASVLQYDAFLYPLVPALAYTFQAASGLYILRLFGFDPEHVRLKNKLVLVLVSLLVTAIAPLITTTVRVYLDLTTLDFISYFTRGWGAGIFSALVILPLLTTWLARTSGEVIFPVKFRERIELLITSGVLLGLNHAIFWTTIPRYFGLSVIFFLPAILTLIAFRFHPRWMTLAVFVTAVQGIGGVFLADVNPNVAQQLLNVEIYIAFFAAMFLPFSAVVEERRRAYAQLETKLESASAADKAKSEFIAILAHELRNPLAPIVSSLEYLKLQNLPPESTRAVHSAETHAEMMQRLLDDLLDTVRISHNKIRLQIERLSVRKSIEDSVASVDDFRSSRGQTLDVTLPKDDPFIEADAVRFRQILINLLNNACKYTPPGGKIRVSAEQRENYVYIEVSDTGIGIAAEDVPRLFEPFQQSSLAAKRGTGLGIGLFLTKQLAEMQGGKILVHSEGHGKGSTFTLYFPIAHKSSAVAAGGSDAPREIPGKILIVDDNEAAANAMQKLLRHYGYDVDVCYGGREAIEIITVAAPRVVLLDIGMPVPDGYEVARTVRERGWSGTLVALSGYGQESDRAATKAAGFDHHLVKPARSKDILALLR